MLAARAGSAVGVDAQILRANFDFAVILDDGRHVQRGKRRVPPGVGVERRDAHQPVHAALGLEVAVGVVAVHLEGDGLDARLVAVEQVDLAHLEAHALGVADVHAVEHLRPVLRLGAARARVQREQGVAAVVFAVEQRGEPERVEVFAHALQFAPDLLGHGVVVLLLGQLHHHLDVVGAGDEGLVVLYLHLRLVGVGGDALGALRVVPEAGGGHVLLVFDQIFAQLGDVKVSHLPLRSISVWRSGPA